MSDQRELMERLLVTRDTQVALRTTQRRIREDTSAVARSRRLYQWQMALAKTEAEKERLRHERKLYIARTWYHKKSSTRASQDETT